MSYSTMNMSYEAPARNSMVAPLVGAAVGAVIGAACFATASSALYAPSVVRPAVSSMAVPVTAQNTQAAQMAGVQFAAPRASYNVEQVSPQASNTAVYGWAFAMFAAVAGAVNGLFLWNSRQTAMAATTGRREALMAGAAAAGFAAAPAFAAYGDAANVFGAPKEVEQFLEISGPGWSAKVPGKYNVSKERDIPGIVGRWEDNFDAVNNTFVVVRPVGKNSVTEIGGLDAVRDAYVNPLLGQQAFSGPSISEGGFAPGRYAAAAILDQKEVQKGGKTYYQYELLTRTADGNEGGRHHLYSIAASNGNLYIFKEQAGDKRWFKGLERPLRKALDSFTVA
jgi:hypothetical protein